MLRLYIWAIKNYTLDLQCVLLKIHAHCRKFGNKGKMKRKPLQSYYLELLFMLYFLIYIYFNKYIPLCDILQSRSEYNPESCFSEI